MSAQRTAQEEDPVATLAEGLSIWVGKLSDLVKKVVDTGPIRNVIIVPALPNTACRTSGDSWSRY